MAEHLRHVLETLQWAIESQHRQPPWSVPVLEAASLPKVEMPNRDGFVGDPRPEIELYR